LQKNNIQEFLQLIIKNEKKKKKKGLFGIAAKGWINTADSDKSHPHLFILWVCVCTV